MLMMKKFHAILLPIALLATLLGMEQNSMAQVVPAVNLVIPGCAEGKDVIYSSGTLSCSVGTPTIGVCGTSPSVSGTDYEGKITAGSGVLTACTLNFSKTLSAVPKCIITTSLGAAWITALSTTAITITAATLTSGVIYYKCWGAS